MGLRERMYELTQVEELDEFLERFPTASFSRQVPATKTTKTLGYVETALDPRENITWLSFEWSRAAPVSNAVAERTGIVHQSPQFILFVDG